MSTVTLNATSDAYTNQANSTTNYGTATDLRVGNDGTAAGTYDSFVTFDLSTLTSNLGAAYLTLHGAQTSAQTGLKVYDVTTNPSETGVTWATQPSADQLQSVTAVGTTSGDYRFDVLPYLQYAKANSISTVTFMLVQDTTNGTPSGYADFSSREGSNAPALVAYTSDMAEAPTADAYIDDSNPSTNYGSDTTLLVGSGYGENSYGLLGFDLTGVQGTPDHAYLHVWADALIGQNIGIAVKPVTGSWTESAVTWNNQPSVGSGSQYVIVGDGLLREYTLDVSDLVTAAMSSSATHVDFELQETSVTGVTSGPYIEFNSREASSNTPSLVFSGAPTIATAATSALVADPGLVGLDVLAATPAGESNLTYTWSVTSSPAGAPAVEIGDNGTNTAKDTSAQLGAAGTYTFQVVASDGVSSVTSNTSITVSQTPTAVTINQPGVSLNNSGAQTFDAYVTDQFQNQITSPTLSWSVSSGGVGGSIGSSTGQYTAPATGTGGDTVSVTCGSVSASTTAEVGGVVGRVVLDPNGDGNPPADAQGLTGFTIYEDTNNDGVYEPGSDPSATSDDNGYFALQVINSSCCGSTAMVSVLPPSGTGWQLSAPSGGGFLETVGQAVSGLIFANKLPANASISIDPITAVPEGKEFDVTGSVTGIPEGTEVTIKVTDPVTGTDAKQVKGTIDKGVLGNPPVTATVKNGKVTFHLTSVQPTVVGKDLQVVLTAGNVSSQAANLAIHQVVLSFNVGAVNVTSAAGNGHIANLVVTAKDLTTKLPVQGVKLERSDSRSDYTVGTPTPGDQVTDSKGQVTYPITGGQNPGEVEEFWVQTSGDVGSKKTVNVNIN